MVGAAETAMFSGKEISCSRNADLVQEGEAFCRENTNVVQQCS